MHDYTRMILFPTIKHIDWAFILSIQILLILYNPCHIRLNFQCYCHHILQIRTKECHLHKWVSKSLMSQVVCMIRTQHYKHISLMLCSLENEDPWHKTSKFHHLVEWYKGWCNLLVSCKIHPYNGSHWCIGRIFLLIRSSKAPNIVGINFSFNTFCSNYKHFDRLYM